MAGNERIAEKIMDCAIIVEIENAKKEVPALDNRAGT